MSNANELRRLEHLIVTHKMPSPLIEIKNNKINIIADIWHVILKG